MSARDCNARDRRRLGRRARALLFWPARSRSASPRGSTRGSGDERSDDAASAAPFSVPGQLSSSPAQSTSSQQSAHDEHARTLRRALEHSADYAGPAAARPQARTVGGVRRSSAQDHNTVPTHSRTSSRQSRLRIISALCLGDRPKPPSRGMGGNGRTSMSPSSAISLRMYRTRILPSPFLGRLCGQSGEQCVRFRIRLLG